MSTSYDISFYQKQESGSLKSAREIVPFIINLLNPTSVVDVGCGIGTWLTVYNEMGMMLSYFKRTD